MQRLLFYVWLLTGIAFIYVLFKTYINISEYIVIPGTDMPAFNRQWYFYSAFGIFALVSLFIMATKKVLTNINKQAWFFPHKSFWFSERENIIIHREVLGGWIYGIGCALNTLFLFSLVTLRSMNDPDGWKTFTPSYFLIACFVIVGLSVISGPIRLAIKAADVFKEDEIPVGESY
jgi:hypothetical protein